MPAKRAIVHVECANCTAKLPLGGITASVTCGTCQWQAELPPEKWRWVMDGVDRTVTSMETILGETSSAPPMCSFCAAPFSDEEVIAALTTNAPTILCGKCAEPVALRVISEESLGLVTGFSAAIGEGAVRPLTDDAPVNIPCSRCGAPLPVDGSTSLPTCNFCHTRTPLPEEVWKVLHANGRVHPFFLWATPKAARAAEKNAKPLRIGGLRSSPIGLVIAGVAVLAIVAFGYGAFRFSKSPSDLVPHGFGRPHEACDGAEAACAIDKKSSLRCLDDIWVVALTCKGKDGCRVVNDGESISCDYTLADLGDPCDVKDSACSTDRKTELKCDGVKFVAADTCKGPTGCSMSPSDKGFTLSCDDHVADVGDPCLEARPACSGDKLSLLTCREGKFTIDKSCYGPSGCTATPSGDQTIMSCDEGAAAKPAPAKHPASRHGPRRIPAH